MANERIAKVLARAGIASRRKAEELVEQGLVKVNGKTITDCATKVSSVADRITVRGKPIERTKSIVLAMNKPRRYLTTKEDTHGRKTIYELLPKQYHHLHPVGRLDKETSGLLLLTNDGELTYQVTHPKFEIRKRYQVSLRGELKKEEIASLEEGLVIPEREVRVGFMTQKKEKLEAMEIGPCRVMQFQYDAEQEKSRFLFEIGEGQKREVRRIFESFGYEVLRLHRVQIGNLSITGIPMAGYRLLREREIRKILFKRPEDQEE